MESSPSGDGARGQSFVTTILNHSGRRRKETGQQEKHGHKRAIRRRRLEHEPLNHEEYGTGQRKRHELIRAPGWSNAQQPFEVLEDIRKKHHHENQTNYTGQPPHIEKDVVGLSEGRLPVRLSLRKTGAEDEVLRA